MIVLRDVVDSPGRVRWRRPRIFVGRSWKRVVLLTDVARAAVAVVSFVAYISFRRWRDVRSA